VIVVGVDGSEPAKEALAWALEEARLRRDTVRVVAAWVFSPASYGGLWYAPAISDEFFRRAAEQAVEETVEALADAVEGIRVERSVVEGPAAQALIDASSDADLLVVGSRGHGVLGELLLGSVGRHCVQAARCPVVIVRPGQGVGAQAA
jgi:nucleotide-binding universal stress UspA family protein